MPFYRFSFTRDENVAWTKEFSRKALSHDTFIIFLLFFFGRRQNNLEMTSVVLDILHAVMEHPSFFFHRQVASFNVRLSYPSIGLYLDSHSIVLS